MLIFIVDRVIKSDRNQLEKKITLDDYLTRVLPRKRIEQGRALYQRYQPQLSQVNAQYGVPGRYIVALWGMESAFGQIQGKEDVISALSTLAFEGRREAFFTKELMAALEIIHQGKVDDPQLRGSWAGAMGQSQFMPSSFLTYGADGDSDGKLIFGIILMMYLLLLLIICLLKVGNLNRDGARKSRYRKILM